MGPISPNFVDSPIAGTPHSMTMMLPSPVSVANGNIHGSNQTCIKPGVKTDFQKSKSPSTPSTANNSVSDTPSTIASSTTTKTTPSPKSRSKNSKSTKSSGAVKHGLSSSNVKGNHSSKKPRAASADPSTLLTCPHEGCNKVFNKALNLRSHIKTHVSDKIFTCPLCTASFRRSHDLKRHARSLHTGVKPFACSRCPKSFSRMDALKRHVSRPSSNCFIDLSEGGMKLLHDIVRAQGVDIPDVDLDLDLEEDNEDDGYGIITTAKQEGDEEEEDAGVVDEEGKGDRNNRMHTPMDAWTEGEEQMSNNPIAL
ncbi:hypothetical protein HDU76_005532 [Blyttiomyces sp. JEL0837]|nr:hypothetical protein HDU76_005532 [Blyttiomyces sp. JEL0837]